jgi:hypothetical protein
MKEPYSINLLMVKGRDITQFQINCSFRSIFEEDVKGFRIQSQADAREAFMCCRRRVRIEGVNITYNASRGACRLNLHSNRLS